jgi:3'-5' exoribonuclease|tara:strand:+ start:5352 stop:6335 length:984 start_codon:yes stop_codon:yes gene_type:complete
MEKITKTKLLNEYKEGDIVNDIFVVRIKKGVSEYAKGYYFSLILTDSSGKGIEYRYWGGADEDVVKELYNSIKSDSVLLVNGSVSSYQGKLQIMSNEKHLIDVLKKEEYNSEDFIKKTENNLEELYKKIEEYIEKIKNEKLNTLLKNIFDETLKKRFQKHPAAISIHHNWIGGLLEHTLEVIKYCETSKEIFPELDEDLLITGAILHDIGKLEEMEMTTTIKGTNSGMFIGHIVLGSIFISNKMKEVGLEKELQDKILHMIISHHGKLEYGSAKEPMFPEARVLYYADEMSSKIAEMINFVKDNKEETEDDFMPKWNKNKPTNIFLR